MSTPSTSRSLLARGLILALLALTLAVALLGRADAHRTEAFPHLRDWRRLPIELSRLPDGSHQIRLFTMDTEFLFKAPAIQLRVGAHGQPPDRMQGVLTVAGSPCEFRTAGQVPGVDNGFIELIRDNRWCGGPPPRQVPLTLTVTGSGIAKLSLWSRLALVGGLPANHLIAGDHLPAQGEPVSVIEGRTRDATSVAAVSRLTLLAWQWRMPAWLLAAVIVVGFLLMAAGLTMLWPAGDVVATTRMMSGAAVLFWGLATLYAVCVPPLQAPDEPDHLDTYLRASGRITLRAELVDWVRALHILRIRFEGSERFWTADRDRPHEVAWKPNESPAIDIRASSVALLWQAVDGVVRPAHVSTALLALRLTHGILFGLAAAFFAGLVSTAAAATRPKGALFAIAMIPTLPFFGTHVSNHAALVACYIIAAGAVVGLSLRSRSPALCFFAMAAALGVAAASGRSSVPMLAAGLLLALAWVLLPGEPGRRWLVWVGLAVAIPLHVVLTGLRYDDYLNGLLVHPRLPAWVRQLSSAVLSVPWWGFAIGIAVLGALVDRACRPIREWLDAHGGGATRVVAGVWALATLVVCAGALVFPYPMLPVVDITSPPAATPYVRTAVMSAWTLFRASQPDELLSMAFWGGFGWLDANPGHRFVTAVAMLSGLALVLHLWIVALRRDVVALGWFIAIALSLTSTVAIYAWLTLTFSPDLHGRYLIGSYLLVIAAGWAVCARDLPGARYLGPALVAVCAGVHAYALHAILSRYF